MVSVGHIAVGYSTGVLITNYTSDPLSGSIIGISIGLITHYLSDAIPHGHITRKPEYFKLKKETPLLYLDLLGGGLLFLTLTLLRFDVGSESLIIFLSMASSIAPDFLDPFKKMFNLKNNGLLGLEYKLDKLCHWHGLGNNALLLGVRDFWQVGVIIFAVFLSFFANMP